MTAIAYDIDSHSIYVSMSSFNNFFASDPRPKSYSTLMIMNPDNGEILHSFIDTFPEHYRHEYTNCYIIDESLYWTGYMQYSHPYESIPCNKRIPILLKTDKNLNPIWRKEFDYPYKLCTIGGITPISENTLIFQCKLFTFPEDVDSCFTTATAFSLFVKLDKNGNILKDTIFQKEVTDVEYFIFTHTHMFSPINDDKYWVLGKYNNYFDSNYLFLQKIDTNFNLSDIQYIEDLYYPDMGTFFVLPSHTGDLSFYTAGYVIGGDVTYRKGLNMKFDVEGNMEWLYILQGDTTTILPFLSVLTPEDELITIGLGSLHYSTYHREKGMLYQLDSEGNIQWIREITHNNDPTRNENLYRMAILPNGDIIATGWTKAMDSTTMVIRQLAWLVRLDKYGCMSPGCESLSTPELPFDKLNFSIYPNPVENGIFYIQTDTKMKDDISIEIHNTLGQTVWNKKFSATIPSIIEVDISGKPSGIYYVSIRSDYVHAVKKIVVR